MGFFPPNNYMRGIFYIFFQPERKKRTPDLIVGTGRPLIPDIPLNELIWSPMIAIDSNEGHAQDQWLQRLRKDPGFQTRYRSTVLSSWVVYTRTWPSPRSFWDRPSLYHGHFWSQYRVKTCQLAPFISTSRNSRPRPIQASGRVVEGSESLARHRRVVCDDSTLCLDKICEGSITTCRTPVIVRDCPEGGGSNIFHVS